MIGRFAPSTTGPAHPGTLLSALLTWLDARSVGGRVLLRLEDLDPDRCQPQWVGAMQRDLAWLGLDWDATELQSDHAERHADALDRLARAGLLYPCACSRADLRAGGRRAPDGGFAYTGTCRARRLPEAGWRASAEPLRVRLPGGFVAFEDADRGPLEVDPSDVFGDPVVRRRDGAVAYQLACVVDDAAAGVDHVVRGRDLEPSAPIQVALQRLLGLPTPRYRHHFLLLEERGQKLAKLHGSVSSEALRAHYDAEALCGWLAFAAAMQATPARCTPASLVGAFDWSAIQTRDCIARFADGALQLLDA